LHGHLPGAAHPPGTYGAIFDRLFYHLGNKTLDRMMFRGDTRAAKQNIKIAADSEKLMGEGTAVATKLLHGRYEFNHLGR
jgi:hypothetical protein